jgi:FkbM family methyltransferase
VHDLRRGGTNRVAVFRAAQKNKSREGLMNLQTLIGSTELIEVADIGAAVINEVPTYKKLLDEGIAHLHAFDGDSRQSEQIRSTYAGRVTVYPDFLSDGTEKTLHIAAPESGMTSLLKPNAAVLKFLNGFDRIGNIVDTQKVATKRLDDVAQLPEIDFLKMDIQGSELTVMQNGLRKLNKCGVIQLEVPYLCLYEAQPSFGEIDVWMRAQGFQPHRFIDTKRWSIAPTVFENNDRVPGNQLLEADIVYVRDPLALNKLDVTQLKKMALVAHYCLASIDLCNHILGELVARNAVDRNVRSAYTNLINEANGKPPVPGSAIPLSNIGRSRLPWY